MKKLPFIALFLSSFFLSCSTEDMPSGATSSVGVSQPKKVGHKLGNVGYNTANIYDYAGDYHYQILETTLAGTPGTTVATIVAATNTAALAHTGLMALTPTFTGITTTQLQWVINNSSSTSVIVNSSGASTNAKLQLTAFLTLINSFTDEDYSTIYASIVNFEDGVIGNAGLTATDKSTVLRTTSIGRYICFYTDYKDRDWRGLKNGVCGAIKGGAISTPNAIALGVASGIQQDL